MLICHPRVLILHALVLDSVGQLITLQLVLLLPLWSDWASLNSIFSNHFGWLIFQLLLYPFLGWLFGSYTVLRWRRLSSLVLFYRLLITSLACLIAVGAARWLINPPEIVWLLQQRIQIIWMLLLSGWSFLVRLALRRGFLLSAVPRLLLLAQPDEVNRVLEAWSRVSHRQRLIPVDLLRLHKRLDQPENPLLVAVSSDLRQDTSYRSILERLETSDPRFIRCVSVIRLFELQQERLPPFLMRDLSFTFDDLPWAASFSVQAQLKRMADLVVSFFLLFVTSPFIALAALFIWLEDRGPIFYTQQRSGWLGRPFTVLKLRTMSVQPFDAPIRWTQVGDNRITSVGSFLRRVRLDELPQLLNVLNGEMSLIGPRPELPELEHQLEKKIPHYRKRHWMRPGLSGWAQVCAPYASSVEDSDLKLSYDLYYMRHFSTWLDLVILFRTVKTILKASGR